MELWEEKCELRMVQEGTKEEAMLKFQEIVMRYRRKGGGGEGKEFIHLD